MKNVEDLQLTLEKLEAENARLRQQVVELSSKVQWFEEQYRLSRQRLFGKSSEQTPLEQINLFNEAESEADPQLPEPTLEEITYQRRKKTGTREELLKDLPVEVIEYRLSEEEQVCSCCGNSLHEMSTEIRTELKIIPAQVSVVKHVRYVYACRNCENNGISTPIVTVFMPAPVIPKSLASPSAIAHVIEQKFVQGVPLYRQEQQFERLGIALSRQTMSNWLLQTAQRWLKPVRERMHEYLLQRDILHADETTLQVLKEPGRPAEMTSYMWLYRSGREGPPIVLYDYQMTRAGSHPEYFLKGFKGWLQVDGYGGYHKVKNAVLVGCWAHARRTFDEALKVLPTEMKNQPGAAIEGLSYCNRLYAIEKELEHVSPEERFREREKLSLPLLKEFYIWLKQIKPKVLPKSALGKAIQYCLNQWESLNNFLQDGRLEIDNNRSERSIKPFVIGRKNWLFSNTPRGAAATATIYSLMETAKENKLNINAYLIWLLERLPNIDLEDKGELDTLMPWSTVLPDRCKIL